MVCVHAALGAAIGRRAVSRKTAFMAGSLSHLVCDLVPHKDYPLFVEAPLAALVFFYLTVRYGVTSRQLAGAAGAIAPDFENALSVLKIVPHEKTVFPTHNETSAWFVGHGRKVRSPLSQICLAVLALWLADRAE